jgi:peroxiredoxin family protein
MLMPPQDEPSINLGTDKNLDPNYKFIFNGQQKPKGRFPFNLPGSNNLAKITALVVAGAVALGLLIIVFSSFFGSKGVNTKQVVDLIARGQEISRVSDLVAQQSKDTDTINLASTTSATIGSDQMQFVDYIHSKVHKKIKNKDIDALKDPKTDEQLQAANQTNSLSAYYYGYLKKHLAEYQTAIRLTATDNPPSLRPILDQSLKSSSTILTDPQIVSSTQ